MCLLCRHILRVIQLRQEWHLLVNWISTIAVQCAWGASQSATSEAIKMSFAASAAMRGCPMRLHHAGLDDLQDGITEHAATLAGSAPDASAYIMHSTQLLVVVDLLRL